MKHLEDRVSDLVDDRLDHDDRDRALAHLAACEQCRAEVEFERYAKAALRSLRGPEPSSALVQNLLSLAEPGGPLPPDRPAFPATGAPVAPWRPRDERPAGLPPGVRPHRGPHLGRPSRAVRYAAAGVLSASALAVGLASLGAPSGAETTPPASIAPPVDQFTVEHARTTGTLPFAEPASMLVPVGATSGDGW